MDSRRCFYFLEIFIFSFFRLQAQIIHTEPVFPLVNQSVIIYYDAAEGNQGLMGYTGDVYAHTGVITNLSTSPSDWKYVKTNWGQNTQETKLERISANYYRLTISPDIRSYYGVPANEQILKMAFVFRSGVTIGGSYKEGKDVGNADIFVDVYPPDLSINITSPQGNHLIEAEGDTILVHAISPQADSMWVFENGSLRKAVAGVFMDDTLVASPINGYWNDHHLIFVAKNSQQIVRDTLFYVVIPQPTVVELPDGIYDGINYVDDSTVILCLQAPGKKNVFAIGDFSNWEILPEYYMNKTADGERFWLEISSLIPAKEYIYQYLVDGKIRISDPYCDKISDPWNDKYIPTSVYPAMLIYPSGKTTGIASVLQTAQEPFAWQIEQFSPPLREKLVIYELLIRDFTTKHTYQSVIDTLNYLVKLGVNAIELMPVMEFEGNSSWGYNPMTYFAPDKYYGPKNDLKKLIDECHKRGIAVILDIVLNHAYGNNPLVKLYWDDVKQIPAADNPWFNQTSPNPSYSWGYDFNHESPYTKQFVYRVTRYWLTEYKADGFRFDFSKGFTNKPGDGWAYDATRIAILKNYTDSIWSVNPQAYVILEHFTDNLEEKILANYGMLLWGNLNGAYCDASMGYTSSSDFSSIDYQRRGWNNPHVVGYMESHDEERLMYKNLTWGVSTNPDYDIKDMTIALERAALAATFFIPVPGPKMIWQFGELGYDYSIDYNGRVGEKPVRWDYYTDWRRHYLYEVYSALHYLKNNYPVFNTTDYSYKLNGVDRRIILRHSDMDVVITGNFDVNAKDIVPGFTRDGKWYEFFSGDSLEVQNLTATITFEPGEYHLWSTSRIPKPASLNTGFVEMEEQPSFRIWPNPANEKIFVSFYLEQRSQVELVLYNISGQKIGQRILGRIEAGSYTKEVPLSDIALQALETGIYIVELKTNNRIQYSKLAIGVY